MSEPPPPPFQPVPIEPLRVESLQYQTPMTGPIRPGIVVAVGIISIVLGSLSILLSGSDMLMAFVFPAMRTAITTSSVTTTTTTSGSVSTSTVFNYGTSSAAQTPVTPVMMAPPARTAVVAALNRRMNLTTPRQEMLDRLLITAGDQMFPFAEALITEDKVAANVSKFGAADDATQYFIIANGRIEVGDAQASFSPTHGDTMHVYRGDVATPTSGSIASTLPAPIVPPFLRRGPTSNTPFVLFGIGSFFNFLLAIYLLIIGILVVRQSKRGRYLHIVYAALKIPVAIFVGVAYSSVMMEMVGSLPGPGSGVFTMIYVFQGLLACIYPVAMLIVMNTRGVKQYYNSIAK